MYIKREYFLSNYLENCFFFLMCVFFRHSSRFGELSFDHWHQIWLDGTFGEIAEWGRRGIKSKEILTDQFWKIYKKTAGKLEYLTSNSTYRFCF